MLLKHDTSARETFFKKNMNIHSTPVVFNIFRPGVHLYYLFTCLDQWWSNCNLQATGGPPAGSQSNPRSGYCHSCLLARLSGSQRLSLCSQPPMLPTGLARSYESQESLWEGISMPVTMATTSLKHGWLSFAITVMLKVCMIWAMLLLRRRFGSRFGLWSVAYPTRLFRGCVEASVSSNQ